MGLQHLTGMIQTGGVHRHTGIVTEIGGVLGVNVSGNTLPCKWADPVTVAPGDAVLVDIVSSTAGQSEAVVTARLDNSRRPATGTVQTVGAETVTVSTVTGNHTGRFIAGTYNSGDEVMLSWWGGEPYIMGVLTAAAATVVDKPNRAVAAPPPKAARGDVKAAAKGSDTIWAPGGWGSWAGGGSKVFQGTYGGNAVHGAWFYGKAFTHLQGRKIPRIQFRIPARLNAGSYNDAGQIHLYAHTASSKPSGDVNRVKGPFNVTVKPRAGADWVDLPLDFAATLINGGGGISISGNPYMGFRGVRQDPQSGRIIMDWEEQ